MKNDISILMLLLGVLSPEWDILAGKSKYAMGVHFHMKTI